MLGLGLGDAENKIELNLEVDSNWDRRDLKAWFQEIWNDEKSEPPATSCQVGAPSSWQPQSKLARSPILS